jgi:hypothetical protein
MAEDQDLKFVLGDQALRSGIRTTEFWLTVGSILLGLALLLFGKTELQQQAGFALLSLSSAGYSISRGFVKSKAVKAAALVLLMVSFVGCGTLNEQYVSKDRAVYEAIAPEYEAYVQSGFLVQDGAVVLDGDPESPRFGLPIYATDEDVEIRLRTLRLWKFQIEEAEKQIQRQKDGE